MKARVDQAKPLYKGLQDGEVQDGGFLLHRLSSPANHSSHVSGWHFQHNGLHPDTTVMSQTHDNGDQVDDYLNLGC